MKGISKENNRKKHTKTPGKSDSFRVITPSISVVVMSEILLKRS